MNDLSPQMQARLNKWRENVLPIPSENKVRKSPGNFVARQRDYGDDIRDFEVKEQKAWALEMQNNPIYRNYR